MRFLQRFLRQFGWVRIHGLHPVIESLAGQEQRSTEELASVLLNEALSRRQVDTDMWKRWQSLSPREQQIAALTCLGYTNPQIAARLGIAVETVRTHTRNVQIKFNVNSKTDLRLALSDWDFAAWDTPAMSGGAKM